MDFVRATATSAETLKDKFLSLSEASRSLPGHPHITTLHRWRLRGIRGVRLATVLIGGRRFVSEQAIADFFTHINDVDSGKKSAADKSSNAGLDRAEALLDREGI